MHFQYLIFGAFLITNYLIDHLNGEEQGNVFLKAAKSVPRIGRSNSKSSLEEMGRFLMKASKSVPRIGRRNQNYGSDYATIPYPYHVEKEAIKMDKRNYPVWSELADRFEYDPELFSSPEYLMHLEQEMGDDPEVYDWDKVRVKRNLYRNRQENNPKIRLM